MITGKQIRAARKLLGWEPFQLAQRAKLHSGEMLEWLVHERGIEPHVPP